MSFNPLHAGDPVQNCYIPWSPWYPPYPYYPAPVYQPMGWECPKCRQVNGPHIAACPCSQRHSNPYGEGTGTSTDPLPKLPTVICETASNFTVEGHDSPSNPVSS